MLRKGLRAAVVVAALCMIAFLGGTPASAHTASVELADEGRARRDGAAVVTLLVTCPSGLQVLEANVSLTQDGQVFAQSGVAGIRCTGRPQRVRVMLSPLDPASGGFAAGSAYASAFVLLLDPATRTTVQAQDAETIVLR